LRVEALEIRVWGLRVWVEDLVFMVLALGFMVQGLGMLNDLAGSVLTCREEQLCSSRHV